MKGPIGAYITNRYLGSIGSKRGVPTTNGIKIVIIVAFSWGFSAIRCNSSHADVARTAASDGDGFSCRQKKAFVTAPAINTYQRRYEIAC